MPRWDGAVEKALLGKFYGGSVVGHNLHYVAKEPGRQSSICAQQTFLHPKIHNYSRNVRLVAGSTFENGLSGIFTWANVVSPPSNSPGSIWFISIPLPLLVRLDNSNRISPFCEFVLIDATRIRYFVRNFAKIFPDWGRGGVYTAQCCILTGIILYSPPLSYSFSCKDPVQTTLLLSI